ncbi:MAG: MBOAT family protein [Clostridia bacterium]|nr:MBOAT family protein [Clostridia bacterium]
MRLEIGLLIYLAVLLPLYFCVPKRAQRGVLLAFCVAFYAFDGWRSLTVLTVLWAMNYLAGRLIGRMIARRNATLLAHREDGSWDKATRRSYRDRAQRRERAACAAFVAVDVVALLASKMAFVGEWMRPLGLAFVALSAVSYLCDVTREQIAPEQNAAHFALYIFYFPQMWQGPINRYGELLPQLVAHHCFDGRRVTEGALRALWGCVKKLVVADTAAVAVGAVLARGASLGGTATVLLVLLYSVQIYADFTGGMDVALGISHILGISLYENFDRPFGATSLADYWRRWHRSLGRFFTDYVFYPLSVSRPSQWLARRGGRPGARLPLYLAMLGTWSLTGIWHGLSWNFVAWGLGNALVLLLERETAAWRERMSRRCPRLARSRVLRALSCLGTLTLVGLLRMLDLHPSVAYTARLWIGVFDGASWSRLLDGELWLSLGLGGAEWCLLGVGVVLMWAVGHATPRLSDDRPPLRVRIAAHPYLAAVLCALAVCAVVVFGRYGIGYEATDFIYGRF